MNIREYIPVGYENAISRQDLKDITSLTDSVLRKHIKAANMENGKPIINLSDGKGYFIPADDEDELIREYMYSEIARSRSIENKVRRIKKYLNQKDQLSMNF